MRLDRITIPNSHVTLAGLVYRPGGTAREPCVILSHGYTASKESMDLMASYLCRRGWPCLAFDFRGHKLGGSGGALHAPAEAVSDLKAAMRWALAHLHRERCYLVGHSMGGLVSFAAAEHAAVAGVAAVASGPHPLRGFRGPVGQALLSQRADYVLGAPPPQFLAQLEGLADCVERMNGRPALFVAAHGDVLVKAERVREWALRAGTGAEIVEVEGSHLDAPSRARGLVANWLDRIAAAAPRTDGQGTGE